MLELLLSPAPEVLELLLGPALEVLHSPLPAAEVLQLAVTLLQVGLEHLVFLQQCAHVTGSTEHTCAYMSTIALNTNAHTSTVALKTPAHTCQL